jgi:hypothetical protein
MAADRWFASHHHASAADSKGNGRMTADLSDPNRDPVTAHAPNKLAKPTREPSNIHVRGNC